MKSSVLIWGAGGHGKVVYDTALRIGLRVLGFVDDNNSVIGKTAVGACSDIILSEVDLKHILGLNKNNAVHLVAAIGSNSVRRNIHNRYDSWITQALVHPTAECSTSAQLGRGTVVLPQAVINASAKIGDGVIINTGSVVEHDCIVGDFSHVSPSATLCGGVIVSSGAWVGAGAVILPNLKIGVNSIIGAGSVVTTDIPDNTVYVGNPARLLRAISRS